MEKMNIQWFPGHMTKARRMISENIKLVDAVCEIIDARIPISSRNPDLDELTAGKPRLVICNRIDQADQSVTKLWADFFKSEGIFFILTDCKTGTGIGQFSPAVKELLKDKRAALEAKGQGGKAIRAMVVGIPNVGKSSFINRVAQRRAAEASDRPGVTRGRQWITVDRSLELLDTPGILWPRFDSQIVGENLAFTGAIRDEIIDRETLAANLMSRLALIYPDKLAERYKIETGDFSGFELLEAAAKKRGFLLSGGELDLGRMAAILLDEFRGGKLGRITLERPDSGFLGN